jgi:hypothetical protein
MGAPNVPRTRADSMDSASLAIQIIPDLTIDDKYATIIGEAQTRINHFTDNALKGGRIGELFRLERSNLDEGKALRILHGNGKLVVGFQFEARMDPAAENFRLYVKKVVDNGKSFKFYLTQTVQDIMLQLISLEDRRTVAIFSMLNSSMDIGYRILTTLYGNQLKRLQERIAPFLTDNVLKRLEKLAIAKDPEDEELWKESEVSRVQVSGKPTGERAGSEENLLQVMADDSMFAEINQYVGNVVNRSERIQKKREMLESNPDIPRAELYGQMVREDLDQLENCYARMHIYLKAFYKNKDKRTQGKNRVLRQFFADQIEKITGETSLLEDLLSLNEPNYFKNLDRHKELQH